MLVSKEEDFFLIPQKKSQILKEALIGCESSVFPVPESLNVEFTTSFLSFSIPSEVLFFVYSQ